MHSSVCGCPCMRERAKGCERGFGWSGAHLALPGCRAGSQAGGCCRRLQAASRCWEAQGGSSALLQTEASLRNASSHFRASFANEVGAPLQSWKEAGSFCREPVTLSPPPSSLEGLPSRVSLHCATHPCNSETQLEAPQRVWEKLFGIDTRIWMQIWWAQSSSFGQGQCLSCPRQTPVRNPALGVQCAPARIGVSQQQGGVKGAEAAWKGRYLC